MAKSKEALPRTRFGNPKMRLTDDVIAYYIERLQTTSPEREYVERNSLQYANDTLYHYGSHFPLAEGIRDAKGRTRLVVCNGDRYGGPGGFGPSTSSRQLQIQAAVREAGFKSLVVPFSALRAAEIVSTSIELLESNADTYTTTWRTVTLAQMTEWERKEATERGRLSVYRMGPHSNEPQPTYPNPDGTYTLPTDRHWLGEATFKATVRERGGYERKAKFLSAFDHNEARECYFLCELPRTNARTVAEAFEALKPKAVHLAIGSGLDVARQGDIFAIPTALTTRELRSRGELVKRSVRRYEPGAVLLNTNHTATEVVVTTNGDTYARGILRHEPGAWREPDHARIRLGDGKQWFRILKNTVPVAKHASGTWNAIQSGSNRAWTLGGAVD